MCMEYTRQRYSQVLTLSHCVSKVRVRSCRTSRGDALLRDQVISSDGVTYVDASHTFSGSS